MFVSSRRVGERKRVTDYGASSAEGEYQRQRFLNRLKVLRRNGEEEDAIGRSLTDHQIARVDLHTPPAPDNDHAAVSVQKRQVAPEVLICEHFNDKVHATSVGEVAYTLFKCDAVMVEHRLRA